MPAATVAFGQTAAASSVKRGDQPQPRVDVDGELVVAAADVLDQAVS